MTKNLMAVKRVDKNGRLVTRHVRDDSAGPSPRAIPDPTAALRQDRRSRQIKEIVNCINVAMGEDRDYSDNVMPYAILRIHTDDWTRRVSALYDSVIETLYDRLSSDDCHGYVELLMTALSHNDDSRMIADLLIATSIEKDRLADWNDVLGSSHAYRSAICALDGLTAYEDIGWEVPDYISATNDYDREIAVGLLRVANTVNDLSMEGIGEGLQYRTRGEGGTYLVDHMAAMVLRRPKDAERICAVIESRRTTDVALIEAVLDSAAPAISGGVL